MSAPASARARFDGAGLPFPPAPPELEAALREVRPWWFSTSDLDVPPYFLDEHVRAVTRRWPGDHLVVAHAGHGVGSWVVCWYLVTGPVAIFVQSSWGGPDRDAPGDAADVAALRRRAEAAEGLLAAVGRSDLDQGGRLAVVDSDLGDRRWAAWTEGEAPTWQSDRDPFAAAEAWVRRVGSGGPDRAT